MNSSATPVIKTFLIIFILTVTTIGLLGLTGTIESEAAKELLMKSSLALGILGIASISIAMLSGSKDTPSDP
jgi:hypothetical protein